MKRTHSAGSSSSPLSNAGAARRRFIGCAAAVGAGIALGPDFWKRALAEPAVAAPGPYGLIDGQTPDANGLLLPPGFTSRIIGRTGEVVPGTSYIWHVAPDGAATFPMPDGGWVMVSNSETIAPLGGGVGAIRFNASGTIVSGQRVLAGTNINCAGGPTPWGTWMSCEEYDLVEATAPALPNFPFGLGVAGMVWECDPTGSTVGVALPALGKFSHEAVAIDPATNTVYLTEDNKDGLFYRFRPTTPNVGGRPDLTNGVLEAAVIATPATVLTTGSAVTWLPVPDPTALTAALRQQVPAATKFNRGEGAWFHAGSVYFTTTGDDRVWAFDVAASTIEVVYDLATTVNPPLEDPDNITVHPATGDLFVSEDDGNLEAVIITTPEGGGQRTVTSFLRLTGQTGTEVTGLCFDPSGTRLYMSSQRGIDADRGITYEITGPFRSITPPPVVPEVPMPVLLGVTAAAALAGAVVIANRRDDQTDDHIDAALA